MTFLTSFNNFLSSTQSGSAAQQTVYGGDILPTYYTSLQAIKPYGNMENLAGETNTAAILAV